MTHSCLTLPFPITLSLSFTINSSSVKWLSAFKIQLLLSFCCDLTVEVVALPVRGGAQLVLLLGLHPPVLEPDLDLPLRQPEVVRDLNPPPPREVAIEVEFLTN